MEILATVNRRALAACNMFQAKPGEVRYYLVGVHIKPSPAAGAGVFLQATDGHKILNIYDPHGTAEKEMIVRIATQVTTKLKAKSPNPVCEIVGDEEPGTLVRIPGDNFFAPAEIVDGKFPDSEKIFPQELPEPSTGIPYVAPAYLAALGAVSKCLQMGRYPAVCWIPQTAKSVQLFAFAQCVGDLIARAAIMPTAFHDQEAANFYVFPKAGAQESIADEKAAA